MDQQVGILAWMLARRGVSMEATNLVEGSIALRADKQADEQPDRSADHAPGAAVGAQNISGGMPGPIEPGGWDPPGDQPGGLYVGTEVHKAIGLNYRGHHAGQDIATNDTPILSILKRFNRLAAGSANTTSLDEPELMMRPDILNLDLRHLYEVKPEAARAQGAAKALMYTSAMKNAGIEVTLGPVNDPGAQGALPAPAGTILFNCVEPGVITYRYRHSRLVPIPLSAPSKKRSREWKWGFEADLTPEQRSAVVTTTLGGAVLILLMVVLAPVGA